MKVYLILRPGRGAAFYSEDPEVAGEELSGRPARPPRGRLERWARALKAALQRAARRGGRIGRRLGDVLARRPAPDEPLLRGLRGADALVLFHPEKHDGRDARREWLRYLARRRRGQALAALVDLGLAVLSLPLALLPGPNVIGLFFLYRAAAHALALAGTRKAGRDRLPLELRSEGLLDEPLDPADAGRVADVSDRLGLKGLPSFLRRLDRRGAPG
jgi:hypothetical protein